MFPRLVLLNGGEAAAGSELLLGASWIDPGEETNLWSSREVDDTGPDDHWYGPVEETYFVIRGRLRLTWDDGVLDPVDTRRTLELALAAAASRRDPGEQPYGIFRM